MGAQSLKAAPEMPSIVCVVVHPSPIFREGLTSMLAKSSFAPACSASSTEDVPSRISGAGEQVLVLIGFRDSSHLADDLSATKASFPDAHLVVVGDSTKRGNVAAALELGATTFVDENIDTSTLVKKLELVTLGEPMISQELLGHCSATACEETPATPGADEPQPLATQEQAGPNLQFSRRETAILIALAQGASNKVIAYQLSITEATVKVHVKAILRKTCLKNRTQAAVWALHHQALPKPVDVGNGELPRIREGAINPLRNGR